MPRYSGDLELINHSAGSISSQAYQKRWNRKNELLAAAAEESSVAAAWLGGRTYPQERINRAWRLVLGGQFHDIMAGTATPQSYNYAWNDDVLALNQFAGVVTSATEAVASGLNTQGSGTPIVVFNPLGIAREDVVEASIHFANVAPKSVRVIGPDGNDVPAQLENAEERLSKNSFSLESSVGWIRCLRRAAQRRRASRVTSDLQVIQAQWKILATNSRQRRWRCLQHLRQEIQQRTSPRTNSPRDHHGQSAPVARVEYGFRRRTKFSARLRQRPRKNSRFRKWSSSRHDRSHSRHRGLALRADRQPLRGWRRQSRRVRQFNRLAHDGWHSESNFSADRYK